MKINKNFLKGVNGSLMNIIYTFSDPATRAILKELNRGETDGQRKDKDNKESTGE